jgi:hypothetical protein
VLPNGLEVGPPKGDVSSGPGEEAGTAPNGDAKSGAPERVEPEAIVARRPPPKGESVGACSEKGERADWKSLFEAGAKAPSEPGGPLLVGTEDGVLA